MDATSELGLDWFEKYGVTDKNQEFDFHGHRAETWREAMLSDPDGVAGVSSPAIRRPTP